MKTRDIVGIVGVIVLIGGVAYWVAGGEPHSQTTGAPVEQQQATDTMGSYSYSCDNGTQFTLTPSADASSVIIAAQGPAPFSTVTLGQVGQGQYASQDGEVSLGAQGEEVDVTVGAATMRCNPVPAGADQAPFNWGDTGALFGLPPQQ